MNDIEKQKSQMRKGMLEFCVLLILRNGATYAWELITQLKEAHLIVVEGTLYPLLNRLKKEGMLSYHWEESTQGPPRKYYSLTPDGFEYLHMLEQSWNEIARAVNHLMNKNL